MFSIRHKGSFKNTTKFLQAMKNQKMFNTLDRLGRVGQDALSSSTPVDSGLTSQSWYYDVEIGKSQVTVTWYNSHVVDGIPVIILLQYGHGTGTGGYVQGRDYINPAIVPVFDQIADSVWKAVTSA